MADNERRRQSCLAIRNPVGWGLASFGELVPPLVSAQRVGPAWPAFPDVSGIGADPVPGESRFAQCGHPQGLR